MTDKTLCDTYHASDAAYASKIAYWTTPIPQCLDGRTDVKCKDYGEWTKAWTEIKG
jgi:putative spermidine/putrescine transport system substrate-binding protein